MSEYELSNEANRDLLGIARYTIKTWGTAQADRYGKTIQNHFNAISRGDVLTREVFDHWPELCVSRCKHHYVFFLRRKSQPPLMLAVFREKMDLMTRLRERLDSE